jgi:putative proteasome-type protease
MDSTIRSNLSVGMPLDLAIVRRDALEIALHRSIEPEDAYFKVIRDGWGESLRNAFHATAGSAHSVNSAQVRA